MKKLLYFLVFLILSTNCFSQDPEKLPAKPWEDIVEIFYYENNSTSIWDTNIYVALEGNYTKKDSATIDTVLKKLDALTETISIRFSKSKKPNFKIKFLDAAPKEGNSYVTSRHGPHNRGQGYTSCELYIYKIDETYSDLEIRNSLESKISKALIGGSFAYPLVGEKRKSIFNPINGLSNYNIPLNNDDQSIIKEVYKKGFEEQLAKAENQFKDNVIKKIQDARISSRDRSLWWVKNPIAVLFLPALILVLLGLFLLIKLTNQ